MASSAVIEQSLREALDASCGAEASGRLAAAMEYAVFPGGGRVRPKLCLAVATACGLQIDRAAMAAATSLELLHCASLVHDDLPCFDDADLRRGKPSVHRAFDEATAVLAGDALILLAFDTLVRGAANVPERLVELMAIVCRSVGMPNGIMAGQAMEFEDEVDVVAYHRSKTASMFVAACATGAVCAHRDPGPWIVVGEKIGEAYQAIDDLLDAGFAPGVAGKPIGQDDRNGRPNLVKFAGADAAVAAIRGKLHAAQEAIPADADLAVLVPLFRKLEASMAALGGSMRAA